MENIKPITVNDALSNKHNLSNFIKDIINRLIISNSIDNQTSFSITENEINDLICKETEYSLVEIKQVYSIGWDCVIRNNNNGNYLVFCPKK